MENQDNVVDLRKHKFMADRAQCALASDGLLSLADEAKRDPGTFFEFVMREETTRARMLLQPHQRVVLDFVLQHDRAIIMLPISTSKTFLMAAATIWMLGNDPTTRGAIVSATEAQAQKVLKMVSDYIRSSPELHLVFPKLQPSLHDPWTKSSITVDRPLGIRDASVAAYGYDSNRLPGSRLDWILSDDLVVPENSYTEEARQKMRHWFDGELMTRIDPSRGRIVLTNTPRHPKDQLHELKRRGWATLRMDIMGGIYVKDDERREAKGLEPWGHPELRKALHGAYRSTGEASYRLARRAEDDPLWPERWSLKRIEEERKSKLPHDFNQTFMCIARNDAESMCQEAWIEECKRKARERGITHMVEEYKGQNLVFMGVDLAFRQTEAADYTAFFVFEQLPDGHRRVLHVEYVRESAPIIIEKILAKQKAFSSPNARSGCVVRVENNAGQQMIVDMLRAKGGTGFPVYEHTTGTNKANSEFGIQSVFQDFYTGAWLVPNDHAGRCHPYVQRWIQACLDYTPTKHADDGLVAAWIARTQAYEWGVIGGVKLDAGQSGAPGMSIMGR